MKVLVKGLLGAVALASFSLPAYADTTLTIGTVNNGDMIRMQGLTGDFTKANPDIKLNWVTLEENVLRQKVTTDIATKGGQFDVMTIGNYETPIWAKKKWLVPLDKLGADYDVDDLLPPIRAALSVDGKLYAAPFYGESWMTMYRKDLMDKAGLKMPEKPTWDFIRQAADKMTDKAAGVYGICLRGKPGWGENMAFLTSMANTFGARWFDEKWQPQFNTPEWKKTLDFYVSLMKADGPPGASSNGFNENLALFNDGKCGMWIDATVAAGFVSDPKQSKVADKVGYALAADDGLGKRGNWLWSWALAIPVELDQGRRGAEVRLLGDKQALHRSRRLEGGLGPRSARNAHLALQEPRIPEGRAFAADDARVDRRGRPDASDREAGSLHWRPVRGDPRVPGHRDGRRPGLLGGARRHDDRRRRARQGSGQHGSGDEEGRLHQVSRTLSASRPWPRDAEGRPPRPGPSSFARRGKREDVENINGNGRLRLAAGSRTARPIDGKSRRPAVENGWAIRRGRAIRMATQQTTTAGRILVAPSVILLFVWMIVPLVMTLYFSTLRYSLLDPDSFELRRAAELRRLPHTIRTLSTALVNTLILVGSVLVISVCGGILVALLMDQPVFGQNVLRLMVIAPFFVMPTVSALVWKNLLMNPDSGLFAWIARSLGFYPIVWFTN